MDSGIRYPWERWLSRKSTTTLKRGVDFTCQPHAMGQQIRSAASKRGLRVSVRVVNNTVSFEVK